MKRSAGAIVICASAILCLSAPAKAASFSHEQDTTVRPTPIPGHPHSAVGYYPPHSVLCDEQGRVILDLAVAADGRVTSSRLITSSGHVDLDRAAAMAVKTWIYRPAMANRKPVAAHTRVAVLFKNEPPATAMQRFGHYVMSLMCPLVDRLQGRP